MSKLLLELPAFLATLSTFLGASCHVFVVGKFLALLCTLVAAFGTTLQHRAGKWALSRAQGGARLAALSTIDAKLRCFSVFLFAISHQREAVLKA